MPHNFLAIDLGAESGRAILGTLDGDAADPDGRASLRQRPGAPARWPALGHPAPVVGDQNRAAHCDAQASRPTRRDRDRYVGRGLRPARSDGRPHRQSLSLPRQPHRRDGGRSLQAPAARADFRSDRHSIHAVEHAVSTIRDGRAASARVANGRNIFDHARSAQLLAQRPQGVRIHHGDDDAVLRSARARVVEAAARRAGHSFAHFPGSRSTRYRVRRRAAGNRGRDRLRSRAGDCACLSRHRISRRRRARREHRTSRGSVPARGRSWARKPAIRS